MVVQCITCFIEGYDLICTKPKFLYAIKLGDRCRTNQKEGYWKTMNRIIEIQNSLCTVLTNKDLWQVDTQLLIEHVMWTRVRSTSRCEFLLGCGNILWDGKNLTWVIRATV